MYANEILLVAKSNRAMNEMTSKFEIGSATYGLRLNKSKCVAISTGRQMNIQCANGQSTQQRTEAQQLGGILDKKGRNNKEVNTIVAHASQAVQYEAVIRTGDDAAE